MYTVIAESLGLPVGPWARTRRAYRSSKTKTLHQYEHCVASKKHWRSDVVSVDVDLVALNAVKVCSRCCRSLSFGDSLDREYERLLGSLRDECEAAGVAAQLLEGSGSNTELTRMVGQVRHAHNNRVTRRAALVTALTNLDAQRNGEWEPVTDACIDRFDAWHETIALAASAAERLAAERLDGDDRFALYLALDHQRRIYQRERRLENTSSDEPGVERLQTISYTAWNTLRKVSTDPDKIVEMVYAQVRDKINEYGTGKVVAWQYVPATAELDPTDFTHPREWATAETERALRAAVQQWSAAFESDLQANLTRHGEPSEVVYIGNYVDVGQTDGYSDLEGFGKLFQLLPRIGVANRTLVMVLSPLTVDWLSTRLTTVHRIAVADEANVAAARTALGYLDQMGPERAHQVALALLN